MHAGVAESPYAASCGLINVGDVLVGIDGVSLYNIGLQAVAKKLQELVKGAKEVDKLRLLELCPL